MLPKARLTSHSRMSGSRWVITPLWLSGSWRSFLHSSSVYSCHLFLISSASVRSLPVQSFIEPIFAWNVPLVSLIFLKRSLSEWKSPSRADSLRPHGLYSPWNSLGQNTGVGCLPISRVSSQSSDRTHVSCIAGGFFTSWATKETQENIGVGSLSLLLQIVPTQELNRGLLHCRRILYQLELWEKRSLVFPLLLFSSISLHWSLRKAFLYLLAILWNSAFKWVYLSFSPLPFTSLLFTAICKASSDNHFAFLHFFSMDPCLLYSVMNLCP